MLENRICIVIRISINRKFIDNTWCMFKKDMVLLHMLRNKGEETTVHVVSVDALLGPQDMPPDLQVFSPVMKSEPCFEKRLKTVACGKFLNCNSAYMIKYFEFMQKLSL